jgi:hypothetical protein
MAIRDNNPNDGKIHAARLSPRKSTNYAQRSNVKRMGLSSAVVVKRRNKVKKGSGIMPAIVSQEVAAMSRAKFYNENRNPSHESGLSCFESQNH